MKIRTHLAWSAAAIILLAFAYFVWPTPWRWDHYTLGARTFPVKINRITGSGQMLTDSGWEDMKAVSR